MTVVTGVDSKDFFVENNVLTVTVLPISVISLVDQLTRLVSKRLNFERMD